jgi:hypothetical protein
MFKSGIRYAAPNDLLISIIWAGRLSYDAASSQHYTAANDRMYELRIGEDLEGNGSDIIEIL